MNGSTRKRPPRKRPGQGIGPHSINGLALDVRGTAAFFGGSEKQTRGLVARGLIPYRRLGGRIIFLKSELEAWLASLPGITLDDAKNNLELRR